MTGVLLCVLAVASLISCGTPAPSDPSATVTSEVVSPACLDAMRNELDGALYKPDSADVSQLPDCESESEEAIGIAAEQVLREAIARRAGSPSPSPAG